MTAERLKHILAHTPMYQVQRDDGTIQKIAYLCDDGIRNVYFDEWECLDDTCTLRMEDGLLTAKDLLDFFWDDAETWGIKNVWWF